MVIIVANGLDLKLLKWAVITLFAVLLGLSACTTGFTGRYFWLWPLLWVLLPNQVVHLFVPV